jgi:hypothetical protein
MDDSLLVELLEETLEMAQEDSACKSVEEFVAFVESMLPPEVLTALCELTGGGDDEDSGFLEEIYQEKFSSSPTPQEPETSDEDLLPPGCCEVCERKVKGLTRHHVYPRETHNHMSKKGLSPSELNTTAHMCRMCHSTVHKFFTNRQLAEDLFSVDLLLADARFLKYAMWASKQGAKSKRVS